MTGLGGGLAWWIWSLALAFVIYVFTFQTGYSVVNSAVQKDAGLSVSQVATMAASTRAVVLALSMKEDVSEGRLVNLTGLELHRADGSAGTSRRRS